MLSRFKKGQKKKISLKNDTFSVKHMSLQCHYNASITCGYYYPTFHWRVIVSKGDSYHHCHAHDHDQKSILPTKCHKAQHDIFMTESKMLVSCKLKKNIEVSKRCVQEKVKIWILRRFHFCDTETFIHLFAPVNC